MSNECQELKNIKYKTMLLNGNQKKLNSVINNISNLDILLDNETKKGFVLATSLFNFSSS